MSWRRMTRSDQFFCRHRRRRRRRLAAIVCCGSRTTNRGHRAAPYSHCDCYYFTMHVSATYTQVHNKYHYIFMYGRRVGLHVYYYYYYYCSWVFRGIATMVLLGCIRNSLRFMFDADSVIGGVIDDLSCWTRDSLERFISIGLFDVLVWKIFI